MNCPYCKTELKTYINGASYGCCPSYPFESGMYCPNWRKHKDKPGSWSDLEIARGNLTPTEKGQK